MTQQAVPPEGARRIVSLLPAATEWICHLGLCDRLVGVSHECDYPAQVRSLPEVTRSRLDTASMSSHEIDEAVRRCSDARTPLYDLDGAAVLDLRPDLIVTQSLCNVCAVSEGDVMRSVWELASDCRLLDLRARNFDQVIEDAGLITEATGNLAQSIQAIESLRRRIQRVRTAAEEKPRPRVTLLEWTDPMFCAGHWTPQLIQWAGGDDPIGVAGEPSRVITEEELRSADPDILLVACCGLDAQRTKDELVRLQQTAIWQSLRSVRTGRVHCFDGSAWFNRPGPRLVDALEAVADLIH